MTFSQRWVNYKAKKIVIDNDYQYGWNMLIIQVFSGLVFWGVWAIKSRLLYIGKDVMLSLHVENGYHYPVTTIY